jgi:hypothetical protein
MNIFRQRRSIMNHAFHHMGTMWRINSPHRQESKPRSSERGSAILELFQERGEMFRDGVVDPIVLSA